MHKDLKTALTATVYLASVGLFQHYGIIPRFLPLALAREDGARPDAPILRSETLNRAHNRRRHMDRLYDKMDDDLYDTTFAPLFLENALPSDAPSASRLQFGSTDDILQQAFSGRAALTSLAGKIDFDSAAGTFPTQSRTFRTPISIWVSGNITDLENRITGSGYDPGLSGDTVSIDSGVDYLIDDGLVVGLGVGWGSTLGESAARQLRYRESNLSVSPYFVARMTDWLNLRGSLSMGKSTITQSAIGTVPDDLRYAETLGSSTISSTIGFGSKYEFGILPVNVELYGDMITAREYVQNARADDGSMIFGNTATTRLFDAGAEGRYRLLMGDHVIVPFAGQEQTISMMNQNYGRSGSTRYYAGSEYAYEPLNFDISIQGFREMATNADLVEGIRSEFALTHDLPRGYATLQPFINVESTNLYIDTGGGMTYDWGRIPGQVNFEVRRKFTYEIHHRDYTGLVSIDFPF
ncbi:MAG: hypothetical protein RIG26_14540 [Thalassospira sp.]|uniref:autotransporter domain-containing protein n=1 Tax=Thalassospira sp. TaxID=1912094 RepID=UPI0032EECE18